VSGPIFAHATLTSEEMPGESTERRLVNPHRHHCAVAYESPINYNRRQLRDRKRESANLSMQAA
jgi:hypothetical protein